MREHTFAKMAQKSFGTHFALIQHCRGEKNFFFGTKRIETKKIYHTMNIKPLADRVLVEPKEAETKTASGLFIPDNAKEKPQEGKVLAVGPGKKDEPMEVKVGDTVLYGKYAGTEVHADGKSYIIMRQSDILATI